MSIPPSWPTPGQRGGLQVHRNLQRPRSQRQRAARRHRRPGQAQSAAHPQPQRQAEDAAGRRRLGDRRHRRTGTAGHTLVGDGRHDNDRLVGSGGRRRPGAAEAAQTGGRTTGTAAATGSRSGFDIDRFVGGGIRGARAAAHGARESAVHRRRPPVRAASRAQHQAGGAHQEAHDVRLLRHVQRVRGRRR